MEEANPFAREIASILGLVRLGRRQACKEVTLWPLTLPGVDAPGGELWPLDEALDDGFVGIAAAGPGRAARVESRAPVPVWIPEGEPVGGAGLAGATLVLPPHGSAWAPLVPARGGGACRRCCRALAGGFLPVEDQVGFVLSVHDRARVLELVLPAGLLARRLRRRVEAWAPLLLAPEVLLAPEGEEAAEAEILGFEAPEALLAAAARGADLAGAHVGLVAPGFAGG